MAKAGEEVLVLSLAKELMGTGVTGNVILMRKIDADHKRDPKANPESASWTTPEEISATISYLCTDEAGMLNGVRIPLYGGS